MAIVKAHPSNFEREVKAEVKVKIDKQNSKP
jgi:hypothetical protein